MTAQEQMQADKSCWDDRYALPLCPLNSNPFIYMAYADLVLGLVDQRNLDRNWVRLHYLKCEKSCGLFYRWPDHSGGQASHDEIMGAAYFSAWIADRILMYLDAHWGNYNVTGEKARFLQFNVYRLPWLKPYLLACAGLKVNWARQLILAAHFTYSAFTNSGPTNAGGRLRNWLMLSVVRDLPLVRASARLWVVRISKRDTLKGSLAIEPKEAPVLAYLAPEEWRFP